MDSLNTSAETVQTNLHRLNKLENYLQDDSSNLNLLIEAFETALQCGQWDRAEFHLRHAQALDKQSLSLALKEGDLLLARGEYSQAREFLQSLLKIPSPPVGFYSVVLHNLAYIEFRTERYVGCAELLAAYMDESVRLEKLAATTQTNSLPMIQPEERALQVLWLRALHRKPDLSRACSWALKAESNHCLDIHAAGVASLIAIDASDLIAARRWANFSLRNAQDQSLFALPIEVYVTQASLALAERKADLAIQWADKALEQNDQDGRAWSARAFALLLLGKLDLARRDFNLALNGLPVHIGTWHGQAWTQLLQRELDSSQASFESALALDRNFAESHGGLAVVLALKKQSSLAQQHIAKALGLDKNNLSGRYAQSILNGEASDGAALQKLARRLLRGRSDPQGVDLAELIPDPDKSAVN